MEEYSVRPLEEKDLRLVLDWRNSERVHSKMLTDHKNYMGGAFGLVSKKQGQSG